jgi:hypothetical protein
LVISFGRLLGQSKRPASCALGLLSAGPLGPPSHDQRRSAAIITLTTWLFSVPQAWAGCPPDSGSGLQSPPTRKQLQPGLTPPMPAAVPGVSGRFVALPPGCLPCATPGAYRVSRPRVNHCFHGINRRSARQKSLCPRKPTSRGHSGRSQRGQKLPLSPFQMRGKVV